MIAEILTIGDELLIGETVDTNSTWIAHALDEVGIQTIKITTISDQIDQIKNSLQNSLESADLVICTGGLGPTHDDISKKAIAEFFDDHLIFNPSVYNNIKTLLARFGKDVSELNKTQAMVPSTCKVIQNLRGTAPGMIMQKGEKMVVSLPGVPHEMRGLMQSEVIPLIQSLTSGGIIHRYLMTFGVVEADLAVKLESLINNLNEAVKIAFLPSPGHVKIRFSSRTNSPEDGLPLIDAAKKDFQNVLGNCVFGYDKETMESVVARLLTNSGKTIATAESCTGGALASKLTSVPGSSTYFLGSIIAYSNEVKEKQLQISREILQTVGAVSKDVVEAMAENVRVKFSSDFALSTSGIAGPDGGTEDKPVGTIWIALATNDKVVSKKLNLGFNRKVNISLTSDHAMDMLRKELLEKT